MASPTPRLTTLVAIQQPEATSAVMRLTSEVRRIDRIEVKLMTWREYLASGDPSAFRPPAADDSAPVWVVAVSGEIVPQFGTVRASRGACSRSTGRTAPLPL